MPRKSMNGHRIHVILTDPQYVKINRLSERTGLPTSELIRRAVDSYIDAQRRSK